eukprot:353547-Chlamydomonas_euryale.AAC.9
MTACATACRGCMPASTHGPLRDTLHMSVYAQDRTHASAPNPGMRCMHAAPCLFGPQHSSPCNRGGHGRKVFSSRRPFCLSSLRIWHGPIRVARERVCAFGRVAGAGLGAPHVGFRRVQRLSAAHARSARHHAASVAPDKRARPGRKGEGRPKRTAAPASLNPPLRSAPLPTQPMLLLLPLLAAAILWRWPANRSASRGPIPANIEEGSGSTVRSRPRVAFDTVARCQSAFDAGSRCSRISTYTFGT